MTGTTIQDLVGRVMLDRDFLAELVRDPDRILAGYALTSDERAIVLEALGRGAPVSVGERAQDLRDTVLKRWAT